MGVPHRAPEPHRHAEVRLGVADLEMRDRVGKLRRAFDRRPVHPALERPGQAGHEARHPARNEFRRDRRADDAMKPDQRRSVGAQAGAQLVPHRGAVLIVPGVVLTAPHPPDPRVPPPAGPSGSCRMSPARPPTPLPAFPPPLDPSHASVTKSISARRPNPPPRWVVCSVTRSTETPATRAAAPREPPPTSLGPA